MTPKEKAIDLLNKFGQKMYGDRHWLMIPSKSMQEDVKQCALIAVDEILQANLSTGIDTDKMIVDYEYWQEVKQEIEKI